MAERSLNDISRELIRIQIKHEREIEMLSTTQRIKYQLQKFPVEVFETGEYRVRGSWEIHKRELIKFFKMLGEKPTQLQLEYIIHGQKNYSYWPKAKSAAQALSSMDPDAVFGLYERTHDGWERYHFYYKNKEYKLESPITRGLSSVWEEACLIVDRVLTLELGNHVRRI